MVAPNDLLGHWLAHYAALGIDFRQRSRVILHTGGVGAEQARAARQLLSEYGVPADLAVNWSSALKMRAAEAYLRSLPPSGYLVWADSDEFMRYPCALAEASRSDKVAVLSSMVERVSLPWRLRPPTPGQRLNASYPRRCLVTACLISEAGVGVATKKPALIPVTDRLGRRMRPTSSHHLACVDDATGELKHCKMDLKLKAVFDHFRFTGSTMRLLSEKTRQKFHAVRKYEAEVLMFARDRSGGWSFSNESIRALSRVCWT